VKIYLDSAQTGSWKLPAGCPAVCGVTTNPSLVHQAGLPVNLPAYLDLLRAAADHGFAELMLQLPSNDLALAELWLGSLRELSQRLSVQLTVKLPCAPDWEACIRWVKAQGQAVLLTGLSNPVQLLWARDMGADYVAPYVGGWPAVAGCQYQVSRRAGPADGIGGCSGDPATSQLAGLEYRCLDPSCHSAV